VGGGAVGQWWVVQLGSGLLPSNDGRRIKTNADAALEQRVEARGPDRQS